MTPTQLFIVAIITAIMASLPGIIIAIVQARAILSRLNTLHLDMNSRLDQLVLAEKKLSYKEGEAAEKKRK